MQRGRNDARALIFAAVLAAFAANATPAAAQTGESVALLRVESPSIAAEDFKQSLFDAAMAGVADTKNLPILPESPDKTPLESCDDDCRAALKDKHFTGRFLTVQVIASGPNYEVRAVFVADDAEHIVTRGTCSSCAADEIAELVRSTVRDVLLGRATPTNTVTESGDGDTGGTAITETDGSSASVTKKVEPRPGWVKWATAGTAAVLVPVGIGLWRLDGEYVAGSCPEPRTPGSRCEKTWDYMIEGALATFTVSAVLTGISVWMFATEGDDEPTVSASVGGDGNGFAGSIRIKF